MLRAVVPTVLLALVLAGCSSSGSSSDATPTTTSDPVGALVVSDAPAGFTLRPEAESRTGRTDLAMAARDDGQPGARAALTQARFTHGYQRLWTNRAGDVVAVQLYRFAGPGGAAAYARRIRAAAHRQSAHVISWTVPDVPAAAGAELDVEGNRTEQVSAARGVYVLQVLCTSRSSADLRTRAGRLTAAQYRRLAQPR